MATFAFDRKELRTFSESCSKADARAVHFFRVLSGENFRERIVAHDGQLPAEAFGEAGVLGVVEPAKDAVAEVSSGTKDRLVDVVSAAVDRADDLEAKEVGAHPIGKFEDGADLFAIVRPVGHDGGVGMLQNDDELAFGIVALLVRLEPDEFGICEDVHGGGRDKMEPKRLFRTPMRNGGPHRDASRFSYLLNSARSLLMRFGLVPGTQPRPAQRKVCFLSPLSLRRRASSSRRKSFFASFLRSARPAARAEPWRPGTRARWRLAMASQRMSRFWSNDQ